MKRIINSLAVVLSITGLSTSVLQAQMSGLHGNDNETRMGIHAGNLYRTSFFNDGTFGGRIGTDPEIAGEWPIGSAHFYVIDGNPMVLSEVADTTGKLVHLISENKSMNISQTRGPRDPVTGEWWTFLPLPGFANASNTRIAMTKGAAEWPNSWPTFWPDIADPNNPYKIYSPDGWAGSWNGYFGRNMFNADEESYFVADDYNYKQFLFFPDSNDHQRRGAGLRMYVRGFQWAKTAVEDGMFILFDFHNIGTYSHEKMVFGFKIGNNMGDCTTGGDAGDDRAGYDIDTDLTYMWDDGCQPGETPTCLCCGGTGWGSDPVGFLGGAFLESPGNPYDGIDNDNDARIGPGPTMTEAMFQPKTLNLNDRIVFINYNNPKFPRTVTTLADTLAKLGKSSQDTLEVYFAKHPVPFKFWAGKSMQEFGDNLFDDNLNGLIDESRGQMDQDSVWHYLYIEGGVGYKYIDYLTGDGLTNEMIDEHRDDGIDNDGDWSPLSDDVGMDGIAPGGQGYTGPDRGEGDGIPTPGEPHFDKTDIDESDMIGLTSFFLYDWSEVMQYEPEDMWSGLRPGYFWYRYPGAANIELLFGSGYFPLVPDQVERFSMGIILGYDKPDLLRNKDYFKEAYGQNYNFAKAPYVPTVRAVAGDNKVTLFWDNFAESSIDPISGEDFEGYKIYRSTDPGWNDAKVITNAYGDVTSWRVPLAQFDLDDEFSGFAAAPTQGVQFYLGKNTGLRHYFVDTTAVNGYTYYYAVTSYDHGDPVRGIDPSECVKVVLPSASGEIETGSNVVIVRPEAPSAGYAPPKVGEGGFTPGPDNTAEGSISLRTYDPGQVKNNHTYQITFVDKDTTAATGATKQTGGFTLVDKTSGDTLVNRHSIAGGSEGLPIVDGFQLAFSGNPLFLGIDSAASGWSRQGTPTYDFRPFQRISGRPVSVTPSGNYEIRFAERGIDVSKPYLRGTTLLPGIPVNFTIINTITNKKVAFAFREIDTTRGGAGVFSFNLARRQSDEIIFLQLDDTVAGWWVRYSITSPTQADSNLAQPGDVLTLVLDHPFLSNDTYEFTMLSAGVNNELAKTEMDKIRVVPNPYIVANSWEPQNPYTTGRGERQLHFTHLPRRCTIRIFNVRGQLINTLEHDAPLEDGTEIWNLLSKDNLEIAYGLYIYHVTAEGVGEKTGKFVVLK